MTAGQSEVEDSLVNKGCRPIKIEIDGLVDVEVDGRVEIRTEFNCLVE
jgi:hypothetical protein